jgi:predicted RNase H-like nuclease (RuvC/YqgF family)
LIQVKEFKALMRLKINRQQGRAQILEIREHIEKLEKYLEDMDIKLERYEAIARRAKGKPSPSFLDRVADLKEHRDALGQRLKELRVRQIETGGNEDVTPIERLVGGVLDKIEAAEHHIESLIRQVTKH